MFHISSDKRSFESAALIRDGLNRLLDRRPMDAISVTDLCHEAGVSRTTFYRLFDTPSDVIRWCCELELGNMVDALSRRSREEIEMPFQANLHYILEHPEPLLLACKAKRIDIADNAFMQYMEPILEHMRIKLGLSMSELRFSTVVVSGIITSAFSAWVEGGMKESPKQLHARVLSILKGISD